MTSKILDFRVCFEIIRIEIVSVSVSSSVSFDIVRYRSISFVLPFFFAPILCSYRFHASSISGKNAEKTIFSTEFKFSGISIVSR